MNRRLINQTGWRASVALVFAIALVGGASQGFALVQELEMEEMEGGGGGGGGGGYINYGASTTDSSTAYCDAVCNPDSACSQVCIERDQTCAGGTYVPPSSADYNADNNGSSTYATTYKAHRDSGMLAETGPKETADETLTCTVTGGESSVARTCGYVGRCAQPAAQPLVTTKFNVTGLSCPAASDSKLAMQKVEPQTGNKWFKFDYKIKNYSKASKTGFNVGGELGFGVKLWNNFIELVGVKAVGTNTFGTPSDTIGGKLEFYVLGILLNTKNPTSVNKASALKTFADEYTKDAPTQTTKTSKQWNVSTVFPLGPAKVKLAMFAKMGLDFPTKFTTVKSDDKVIGFSFQAGPKGYIHGGASATLSVWVASVGVKGTVNLLSIAVMGKVFQAAQDMTTFVLNVAQARSYFGVDVEVTSLDGKVELILRLLWKKWKIKLASWTGLRKTFAIGNGYSGLCRDLSNGTSGIPGVTASDYTSPNTTYSSTCTPATCESLSKTCGTWSDGCSGTLTCGSSCSTGGGGGGGGGGSGSYYY